MSTQLLLFPTAGAHHITSSGQPQWLLDDATREIGRRRIAEARAILRAQQRAARTARYATEKPAA